MNLFSKRVLHIFLFATVSSCYGVSLRRSGPLRVISGRDVSPGQFLYVVRIELTIPHLKKYYHKCTGSALTPTATLTAGHCYKEEIQLTDRGKYVVRYGSAPGKPADNQLDKFSDVLNCLKPPAAWKQYPFLADDLAIFMTEPIQLRSYGKISSLDYPSLVGLHVTLTGYGKTNRSNSKSNTKALSLPLQVIDGVIDKCEELLLSSETFPLLCTHSACGNLQGLIGPGDSGGPVVHSAGIIGVNSRSMLRSDKDPDYARIPTQVLVMPLSPYIDWLMRTLHQILIRK